MTFSDDSPAIVLSAILLSSVVSLSARAASFVCTDETGGVSRRVIAETDEDGRAATITVQINSKIVYSAVPVVFTYTDRSTFQSPTFTNANGAPASLYFQIFETGSRVLGDFTESSYLPIVRSFGSRCHYQASDF